MSRTLSNPLRILIVDDHPVVRLGLRQVITAEPDLSICCEAETAEAALELVRHDPPDLAIVDLSLGTVNGLELIKQFHDLFPTVPVLVLSMHDEALFAERALMAGARGYIMKQEAIGGLIGAIRQVVAGRIYVSGRVSQEVLQRLGQGAMGQGARIGTLTNRELEVLEQIGRGLATAEIADRLRVSVKTIETYRSNIKAKLNLKDANELIRYATSWIRAAVKSGRPNTPARGWRVHGASPIRTCGRPRLILARTACDSGILSRRAQDQAHRGLAARPPGGRRGGIPTRTPARLHQRPAPTHLRRVPWKCRACGSPAARPDGSGASTRTPAGRR